MAKGITDSQYYTGIAAAIRTKNGEESTYKPSQMAAAILAIEGGGGKVISSIDIYEYIGTFAITYADGSIVTGNMTFDENGLPISLTDDNGNTVNFTSGYPYSATDKNGNSVSILWG